MRSPGYVGRRKRMVDLAVVAVTAPITAPLAAAGWLAVRLVDGPPGVYRQDRVGQGFRNFRLLKLRSMRTAPGSSVTMGADSRITTVGRHIRRWKLDELPQLLNVARGEMSIVGPRPEVPDWVDRFREAFEPVLTVPPGLTDLASVIYADEATLLGTAADGTHLYESVILPSKIELGRIYAENASLTLDLRVIGLTAAAFVAPAWAKEQALRVGLQLGAHLDDAVVRAHIHESSAA